MDEAWNVMQYEDSARFLYGLIKRARKYYLGVTTITQDVEDFMNSPYGKPIVTNAAMQILLKQAPSAVDSLKKAFNLTEGEKYLLLNAGVGQGVFFAGRKHVAIQIVASPKEHEIVTTNPEEIARRKAEEEAREQETRLKETVAAAETEAQKEKEEEEEKLSSSGSDETASEESDDTKATEDVVEKPQKSETTSAASGVFAGPPEDEEEETPKQEDDDNPAKEEKLDKEENTHF